jgi:DNA-binding transcriptional ArsR family regulator
MMDNKNVQENMDCIKDIEEIFDNELFRVLSEPVRCNLIKYLAIHGENDIRTISESFTQDRSVLSRHLYQMYKLNILNMRKEERRTIYSLNAMDLLEKFESTTTKIRRLVKDCNS